MARSASHSSVSRSIERSTTLVKRAVRLDAQQRISLKKVIAGNEEIESFDVYRRNDGAIVLQPRVSVPAAEAWLFKNPKALASVHQGMVEAAAGDLHDLGSFAKYAKEGRRSACR
jgi:hypothetical protein